MEKIVTPEGVEQFQLTMDEFKEAVQDNVQAVIKELGLDKIDMKHEVFPGQDNPEDLEKSKHERQAEFFRSIVTGDIAKLREIQKKQIEGMSVLQKRAYEGMLEGTDASGGYLVPEEFVNEVIRLVPNYGWARKLCRVISQKTDTLKIPTVTADVTAYWIDEAGAINRSKPTIGQIVCTPKKAGVLVPATSELIQDTDLLLDIVRESAALQFAGAEDNQFFNGTGSSPAITGIFASSNVTKVTMDTGKTSLADMGFNDVIEMENAVDGEYLEGASWVMNKAAFKYVRLIKDDAGQYLYVRQDKVIDEYPYIKAAKAPSTVTTANKGQIALGNFKKSHILADRMAMTVKLLSEANLATDYNLATQDLAAFRFIERVDIQEALPSAVAVLWTAAA